MRRILKTAIAAVATLSVAAPAVAGEIPIPRPKPDRAASSLSQDGMAASVAARCGGDRECFERQVGAMVALKVYLEEAVAAGNTRFQMAIMICLGASEDELGIDFREANFCVSRVAERLQ